MIALRLVVDTNVVVSAALVPQGLPRTVMTIALTRPAKLYISPKLLGEYQDVLMRRDLRIPRGMRQRLLHDIITKSRMVRPSRILEVTSDRADNIFLECADASSADYLVTGNAKHFPLYWKRTKVVSPREFMDIVTPHLLP
ncbi:MAG: putative toxin-antitoxin system toxin component, PIN family [Terriglobales bacterium]